jgi:hypothetical protein
MSRPVRLTLAAIVALLVTVAIGALTRVPYSVGDRELAAVRLTWRMAGQAIEDCRTLSEEELAEIPAHMRQAEVCESYVPPYRLRVQVDGETIEDILVLAGGARGNRPIYVYSELRVAPGSHELSIVFAQEAQTTREADAGQVATDRNAAGAPADRLELHETIDLAPGQVALVIYDREARSLVLR